MVEILDIFSRYRATPENGPFRGRGPIKSGPEGRQAEPWNRCVRAITIRRLPSHKFDVFPVEDATEPPARCGRCVARWCRGRIASLAPIVGRCRRLLAARAAVVAVSAGAQAQSKLEARYAVSLAGIPLGTGTWVIDITGDQYTAVASGRTTGLVKLIANGSGSAGSRGAFQGASVASSGYMANTISDKKTDEVRMMLRGGVVKEVMAEPPLEPSPDRVPVTEAHRKGVIDPMSAGADAGRRQGRACSTPEACKRKLAIFDGRTARRHRSRLQAHGSGQGRQGLSGPGRGLHRALQPGRRASPGARPRSSTWSSSATWRCGSRRSTARACWCRSASRCRRRSVSGVLQANYFVAKPQPTQAVRQTPASAKTQ